MLGEGRKMTFSWADYDPTQLVSIITHSDTVKRLGLKHSTGFIIKKMHKN